jgi:quercetin dioxygenase-like cupin family protein
MKEACFGESVRIIISEKRKINMKNTPLNLFFVFLLMLSFTACGEQNKEKAEGNEKPTSAKEVSPQVLFENDYAEVLQVSLAPGESLPLHDGEKRVIYSLSDYTIDWEEKGEQLGARTWKKGDVHFHEAGAHAAKNSGTTPAEWLVFARKNADSPEGEDNAPVHDINEASPNLAQTVFENDDFKVTQVSLPKGGSIPAHSGGKRVVYSLSDYDITYESDTEGKSSHQFKAGEVHAHEAGMHSLANTGETEAKFLVIVYK